MTIKIKAELFVVGQVYTYIQVIDRVINSNADIDHSPDRQWATVNAWQPAFTYSFAAHDGWYHCLMIVDGLKIDAWQEYTNA